VNLMSVNAEERSDLPATRTRLTQSRKRLMRLDSLEASFLSDFHQHRDGFLNVLARSYAVYYGDSYHLSRITEGRSIVYFALVDGNVVAASYVKRNLRRGVTAVFPEIYRRYGLARMLIDASFNDFPEQYSIVELSNLPMIALLQDLGFKRARCIDQVAAATGSDLPRLSDFSETAEGIVFKRYSEKRDSHRESLTLLYRQDDDENR
jgi:hypothetical protein